MVPELSVRSPREPDWDKAQPAPVVVLELVSSSGSLCSPKKGIFSLGGRWSRGGSPLGWDGMREGEGEALGEVGRKKRGEHGGGM